MISNTAGSTNGAELLPCPFCGGPVKLEMASGGYHEQFGQRQYWGVVCRNTTNVGGTCAMEQVPSASPEVAEARWNRRAAPPAGSATGIDLSALEQLARAADQGEGQHVYMHPRDSNKWRDNANWQHAADPATVLALIALARATPQHPEAPAGLTKAECKAALRWRDVARLYAFMAPGDEALAEKLSATPQHSVTEQALPDVPSGANVDEALERYGTGVLPWSCRIPPNQPLDTIANAMQWELNDLRPLVKAARAQPLASTAATQPEQSSDWTVGNLLTMSDSEYPGMGIMFTQIWQGDDLIARVYGDSADEVRTRSAIVARAALAIPASTAATQPEQVSEFPPLPEMESLADIEYAQRTPDDWDADYRATWQKLQVAERNKMQWRAYALQIRAALAIPASTVPKESK